MTPFQLEWWTDRWEFWVLFLIVIVGLRILLDWFLKKRGRSEGYWNEKDK